MSTATTDSVGSRMTIQASRNRVLRHLGVDADAVNWSWLSDKERFSFEAFDGDDRLTGPLRREGDDLVPTTWAQAYRAAAASLQFANPARVAVLGGARLANEAQYAWAKLVKGVVGTDHVDAQLADGLPPEVVLGLPRATIDQACTPGGTIVLLGPDPKEELGTLYLRLRHAVVHDGATLVELTPRSTGLSPYAAHSLHPRPGEVAELARALTAGGAPAGPIAGVGADEIAAAARTLTAGGPLTVVVGRPSLAEAAGPAVDAARVLHERFPDARFLSALRRGNVHGALDLGLAPGLLPGRATLDAGRARFGELWPTVPETTGLDAVGICAAAAEGRIDVLVLLGADPLRDLPDADLARRALAGAGTVIAVDLFVTESVATADLVLAAAGPGEVDGSFTNLEGRVSLLTRMVTPPGTAQADWVIAVELAAAMGTDLGLDSIEAVWAELARVAPIYANAGVDPASVRAAAVHGVLVVGTLEGGALPDPTPVPPVDAYALRLVATRSMFDLGTMLSHSPSMAGLASGTTVALNPHELETLGVSDGDQLRLTSPRAQVTAAVTADRGVPRGVAALVVNQPGVAVTELIDAAGVVTDVRVERT